MLCLMAMCDGEDSLQFFTELYMRYKPVLFREASKFTDDFNIVEDLIHDSFVKLIEKEDLLLRRKRRLERLEDIGYSSSDFDQLLSQKRSSAPSYKKQKHKVKRPRRKTPFDR